MKKPKKKPLEHIKVKNIDLIVEQLQKSNDKEGERMRKRLEQAKEMRSKLKKVVMHSVGKNKRILEARAASTMTNDDASPSIDCDPAAELDEFKRTALLKNIGQQLKQRRKKIDAKRMRSDFGFGDDDLASDQKPQDFEIVRELLENTQPIIGTGDKIVLGKPNINIRREATDSKLEDQEEESDSTPVLRA